MRPADDIDGAIKKLHIEVSVDLDKRVHDDITAALAESERAEPARREPNAWKTLVKSRIAKPVLAAIVVAALIGLAQLLPSGKTKSGSELEIEIPPELAQMSAEELIEIHFGRRQSAFGSDLVMAAAERALSGLSARQIMALTTKTWRPAGNANKRFESMGTIAPPPGPPPARYLWSIAGFSDLVVQARVDRVEIDASDARAAILEKRGKWVKERGVEEFVARIKGTVQLDVRASYPASVVENGEPLVIDAVFCTTQRAGHIEEGKEYLVGLKQQGQTISMWPNYGTMYTRQEGIYPVDSNSETVSGLTSYGSMPLDHTWQYIMDAYDAIHERVFPPPEVQDYWLAKLQSDDLIDSWTAVDYFTALVRYCWLPKLKSHNIVDGLTAVEYLNMVDPEAVAEAVVHQRKMLIKGGSRDFDRHSGRVFRRSRFVMNALDLLIKLGDADTNSTMVELYKRERQLDDSIFSERAYGNYDTMINRINSLVPSGSPEAEKSLRAVLEVIKSGLTAEDNEFIPFLVETLTRHSQLPRLIAEQTPDRRFVPVLRETIEHNYSGDLVWALYACGREEEAAGFASEHVLDYLNDPNAEELSPAQHYSMWRTIRFLGISDSQAAADLIEPLTYPDAFRGLRGYRLQAAAIMAFARMAGDRAIRPLRELYATGDYYIRTAAAVSLYYLGDDTGYDLLELFIKHEKHSVPETKKFWLRNIWNWDAHWGRPFYEALLYLRSPQIEELFLDRLRNGVRKEDMQALTIARQRQREVLPILVEHLNSRGRGTRDDANKMLKRLTGEDFGFSPWRYPLAGKQIEALDNWRAYVDEYLAESAQPRE